MSFFLSCFRFYVHKNTLQNPHCLQFRTFSFSVWLTTATTTTKASVNSLRYIFFNRFAKLFHINSKSLWPNPHALRWLRMERERVQNRHITFRWWTKVKFNFSSFTCISWNVFSILFFRSLSLRVSLCPPFYSFLFLCSSTSLERKTKANKSLHFSHLNNSRCQFHLEAAKLNLMCVGANFRLLCFVEQIKSIVWHSTWRISRLSSSLFLSLGLCACVNHIVFSNH